VGINPSTNIVYVGNSGDHTVSVIDGKTNNVTGTIKVGDNHTSVGTNPIAVAVNPSTNIVYVGNSSSLCRKSGQISNGSIDGLLPDLSGLAWCIRTQFLKKNYHRITPW